MIYTHMIAAIVAALAVWFFQDNRYSTEIAELRLAHTTEVNRLKDERQEADRLAGEEARRIYREMTTTYQGALNAARTREDAQRRDAVAARAESDSLRSQLSEAARRIADAPPATLAEYATATSELLAVCSRERTYFAEKADGHASDVRTLSEAWPVTTPEGGPDAGSQD